MTILVIEHHDRPSRGIVGTTLEERGVETRTVWASKGDAIPASHEGYDGMVLLGGAMNVMDDAGYPYYEPLMTLVRRFHANRVPLLGICHGAQMIARTFDAKISLAGPLEFGFHTITPTDTGSNDPVMGHMGDPQHFFQWHTDHYDLPAGAESLAIGASYANQCYRIGPTTYGTQFHFEVDRPLVESWLDSYPDFQGQAPGYEEWLPRQFDDYLKDSINFCATMTHRWLGLAG